MPDAASWKRRYERAEAGRLAALDQLRDASRKLIDIAADDQQKQIDALEQIVLKRAALTDIRQDGRKLHMLFTRRGELHQVTTYADMSTDVRSIRKTLLED